MRSPEEVLGIPAGSGRKEIRGAYRRLARIYHPDHWLGADPQTREECEQRMREVNAAYAALTKGPTADQQSEPSQSPSKPPRPGGLIPCPRCGFLLEPSQAPCPYCLRQTARPPFPDPPPGHSHLCAICHTAYDDRTAHCPRCYWPRLGSRDPSIRRSQRSPEKELLVVLAVVVVFRFVFIGAAYSWTWPRLELLLAISMIGAIGYLLYRRTRP